VRTLARLAALGFLLALLAPSLARAAGFTESEDQPIKDPDNSEDDPLGAAAPVPWNLAPFAISFPGGAKLIRGTLDAHDVDAYAFSLNAGQLLLAALFEDRAGEKNDTALGLFSGTAPPPLTSDDDSGPGFFSRLAFSVTSSGTQRVAVSGFGDTSWNGSHQEAASGLVPYRLVVAAVSNPPPFQEIESNNTLASANALPPEEGVIGGALTPGDVDYYKIDLEPGDRLALSVFDLVAPQAFASANGERNDALLGVFTPAGVLATGGTNDDGGPGFQSNLLFTVPAGQGGTWKVAVSGFGDGAFTGAHAESFSYLLVVARERACPNVTPLISGVTVSTGKTYQTANLIGGQHYYVDRNTPGQHVLVDVPSQYECSQWLMTANDDKAVSSTSYLTFTLAQAASVYVAFDTRSATEPPWLGGFTETGDIVDIADPDKTQEFRVLRRDFAAGPIVLGGNLPSGAMSNYVVFARPLNLADPQHAYVIQGLPSALIVTIDNVAISVQRQAGQTVAQLAAAVAAAINANPSLNNLRIFALASGNAIVTTGVIQSVNVQSLSIPALPLPWAVVLCAALGLLAATAQALRCATVQGSTRRGG
jgi:hypothetical protein